jgi:hypothetical protein
MKNVMSDARSQPAARRREPRQELQRMLPVKTTVAMLVALLVPVVCGAAIEESLARQIYSASSTRQQLESVASQVPVDVRGVGEESRRALPVSAVNMEAAARRAYSADALEKTVIAEMQSQLQPAEAQEILAWFNSPLGRNFTALVIAAGQPEEQAKLQRFAQAIQNHPPPEDRLALMESLQDCQQLTEGSTQLLLNMNAASAIALLEDPLDENALRSARASLEAERPRLNSEVGALMLVLLTYSYRDVSNEDVQKYVAFCSSPAGTSYYRTMVSAFDEALRNAQASFAQNLAALARAAKK